MTYCQWLLVGESLLLKVSLGILRSFDVENGLMSECLLINVVIASSRVS